MKQATLKIRYSIVVKCTSAAEADPGKPTLDIKLFPKSDSPFDSLQDILALAALFWMIRSACRRKTSAPPQSWIR